MLIKLGIVIGALALGAFVFQSEFSSIFPSTSKLLSESLAEDTDVITDRIVDSVTNKTGIMIDSANDVLTRSMSSVSALAEEKTGISLLPSPAGPAGDLEQDP